MVSWRWDHSTVHSAVPRLRDKEPGCRATHIRAGNTGLV